MHGNTKIKLSFVLLFTHTHTHINRKLYLLNVIRHQHQYVLYQLKNSRLPLCLRAIALREEGG